MLYKYKGIDKNKIKIKGLIEANSLDEAKSKLKQQNIIYSELKEKKIYFKGNYFIRKIPLKTLANISRNLSIYLKSGVSSIVYAVKLEKLQYQNDKKLFAFFNEIENYMEQGKSFSSALEYQKIYTIPAYYKQSIKVAEESGTLQIVLKLMGDFLYKNELVKNRISKALSYPMFIIVVSIFMISFMLTFVMPKITKIFLQVNQNLPTITEIVISTGNYLKKNWSILAITTFLLFFIFIYLYKTSKNFKYIIDRSLLKIPLFGKIVETSELAKFSSISSILLHSGVTFVESVKLASNTIKNSAIAKVFLTASNELVKGEKLSNALNKEKFLIDPSFVRAIALGEETSQLEEVLSNLSELYNEENSDKINMFLSLIEPMLILIVGLIVGIIVVAMLLPIFSINING